MGTIVNNRVLVVHGGISDSTDLDLIKSMDRSKVSLRRIYVVRNLQFSSFMWAEGLWFEWCVKYFDRKFLDIRLYHQKSVIYALPAKKCRHQCENLWE